MKRANRTFHVTALTLAASLVTSHGLDAAVCENADPGLELGGVKGDFEITPDYHDTEKRLILTSNVAKGASSVIAVRVGGQSGKVIVGSKTVIAGNFNGTDGPEFVQKPTGELGILYAGPSGVHGAFRSANPVRWNDFNFDAHGATLLNDPPALPDTSPGAHPKGGTTPLGQNTYAQKEGDCDGICYARLDSGTMTDVTALATARGFTPSDTTQSPRDGYVYLRMCKTANPAACGLYEAKIDNMGGIDTKTFKKLVAMDAATTRETLRAGRHPVTGSTVIFSGQEDATKSVINVWEQPAAGGALRSIATVPVLHSGHYRVEANTTELVLHYLIQQHEDSVNQGSYTVPVTATGDTLVVGSSKKISTAADGAEFVWAPAANKWALFYRNSSGTPTRCWVEP